MNGRVRVGLALVLWLMGVACLAAEIHPKEHASPGIATSPPMEVEQIATHHVVRVDGTTLNYQALAGYMPIKNEVGNPQAKLFFVAYTAEGLPDLPERPITFAFNGAPGTSSAGLHLGALGPKRVVTVSNGTAFQVTYRLVDNEQTWLDFTDLVFADPIGVGYSRVEDGVDAKQFYGTEKDTEVSAQFVREYVAQTARWRSPKFVVGECYGAVRAAGLANTLQSSIGSNLKGLVLLSSTFSFRALANHTDNNIAFALLLPSFAAATAFHKNAFADLTAVEQWALNDYLAALTQGDDLPPARRQRIAEQMAMVTGLSANVIDASHLRVGASRFVGELLSREHRTLDLLDARLPGGDDKGHDEPAYLVSGLWLSPCPATNALVDYLHRDLNFVSSVPYELLSQEISEAWKGMDRGRADMCGTDDLAAAMARDERFRVFAAAGIYDLTTPYLGQHFALRRLDREQGRCSNLVFKVYPAGQQIYTDSAMVKKLRLDVARFIDQSK